MNEIDFDVKVASLGVQDDICLSHHVVITLGDDGNQEVQKHDQHEEDIHDEQSPWPGDHHVSKEWVGIFVSWHEESAPVGVNWGCNVTNGILEDLDGVEDKWVDIWIISVINWSSWNSVQQSEEEEPCSEEEKEVSKVLHHLENKLDHLSEGGIDSQEEHELEDGTDQHSGIEQDPQEYVFCSSLHLIIVEGIWDQVFVRLFHSADEVVAEQWNLDNVNPVPNVFKVFRSLLINLEKFIEEEQQLSTHANQVADVYYGRDSATKEKLDQEWNKEPKEEHNEFKLHHVTVLYEQRINHISHVCLKVDLVTIGIVDVIQELWKLKATEPIFHGIFGIDIVDLSFSKSFSKLLDKQHVPNVDVPPFDW